MFSSEGQLDQQNIIKEFRKIMKIEGNQICADCGQQNPLWTSLNLGVLICLKCSGNHRSMGLSVSRVRSIELDSWTSFQISIIKNVGNKVANDYWEYKMHKNYVKPNEGSTMQQRLDFQKDKYITKKFSPKDFDDPVQEFINSQNNVKTASQNNVKTASQNNVKTASQNNVKTASQNNVKTASQNQVQQRQRVHNSQGNMQGHLNKSKNSQQQQNDWNDCFNIFQNNQQSQNRTSQQATNKHDQLDAQFEDIFKTQTISKSNQKQNNFNFDFDLVQNQKMHINNNNNWIQVANQFN